MSGLGPGLLDSQGQHQGVGGPAQQQGQPGWGHCLSGRVGMHCDCHPQGPGYMEMWPPAEAATPSDSGQPTRAACAFGHSLCDTATLPQPLGAPEPLHVKRRPRESERASGTCPVLAAAAPAPAATTILPLFTASLLLSGPVALTHPATCATWTANRGEPCLEWGFRRRRQTPNVLQLPGSTQCEVHPT